MNKILKIFLALILVVSMMIEIIPANIVHADEEVPVEETAETVEAAEEEGEETEEPAAPEATEAEEETPPVEEEEPAAEEDDEIILNEEAFSDVFTVGDLTVSVSYEAGTVPEGTEVVVSEASEEALSAIREKYGENADVKAADISFVFGDEKIEPKDYSDKKVSVVLSYDGEAHAAETVHVKETVNEDGEVVYDVQTVAAVVTPVTETIQVPVYEKQEITEKVNVPYEYKWTETVKKYKEVDVYGDVEVEYEEEVPIYETREITEERTEYVTKTRQVEKTRTVKVKVDFVWWNPLTWRGYKYVTEKYYVTETYKEPVTVTVVVGTEEVQVGTETVTKTRTERQVIGKETVEDGTEEVVHTETRYREEEVGTGQYELVLTGYNEETVTVSQTVSFEADDFSVYAVVPVGEVDPASNLYVNFINGEDIIATMEVKNSDDLDDIKKIVYDPGVGVLGDGLLFDGWSLIKEYTKTSQKYTIEQIQTYINEMPDWKEGDELNVYARILKVFSITYLSPKGVSLGSDAVLLPIDEETATYKVSLDYEPEADDEKFEGWIAQTGGLNIDGWTADSRYHIEDIITISGDIVFSIEVAKGHWLIFDENGKGATYNAPRFYKAGEVTSAEGLLPMARYGYTFDGWYEEDLTTPFVFGSELSDNKTIYAKWSPNETANYVVIIWKQNVNDNKNAADSAKTYDFAESVTLTGDVGSTVSTVTATGTGNNRYARVNGVAKQYEGFHLNRYDTNVVINTEGNAVVNVYYDRNLITLTFQYRQYNSWATQITMTGLYGSTLAQNGYTWPTNRWWYDDYDYTWSGYSSAGTRTTFLDAFIISDGSSDQTFYGFEGSGQKVRYFYKKNAETGAYELANTTNGSNNSSFSISDKYNGYKAAYYSTDGTNWTTLTTKNSDGYYATGLTANTLYIRYDPLVYNILYLDGVYVTGDNNPVEGYASRGELAKVENIPYNASTESYNKGGANYYAPEYDGFTFAGWYIDDQCTQAYTFTTMPEGITVYARWVQNQYRVFLHPNAGTDPTLNWGSATQAMNFRVSNGSKISLPQGQREGYNFIGWYTDPALKNVYPTATVLNDSTSYLTDYDKTTTMTDPMDKWGNGATWNSDVRDESGNPRDRFWITKKIDLYAKWSEFIPGADGIGVIYDANGGTNAPTDTTLYKDNVDAIAQAASTAPEGKKFLHWVVQEWDENLEEYVDTDATVYPGAPFTVLKSNAKVVVLEYEPDGKTIKTATYTVQLRAEYDDADSHQPTHITWYGNGGTLVTDVEQPELVEYDVVNGDKTVCFSGLRINENISIVGADNFSKPGYKFLGWARVNEPANAYDEEKGEAIESAFSPVELTAADLWLIYNETDKTFTLKESRNAYDGTVVSEVAADEDTPYHALYAVWEEEFFYVFHSSDCTVEKVSMTALTNGKYDITSLVKETCLYGGYYSDYAGKGSYDVAKPAESTEAVSGSKAYVGGLGYWKKASAFTSELINKEGGVGTAMVPVANHTYFLKEVPAGFLTAKIYLIYDAHNKNTVVENYLLSVVDDNNYGNVYLYAQSITTGERIKLATSYTINDTFNNKTDKIKASSFGMSAGYVAVWKPALATADFEFAAGYVTPDGVAVEGEFIREITVGDGTYTGSFEGGKGFVIAKRDNERVDWTKPGQLVK